MDDIRHLEFAQALGEVGKDVLSMGFGTEVTPLSPILVQRWVPSYSLGTRLRFYGEQADGCLVVNTNMALLTALWCEMMCEELELEEEDAHDLLGEIGNQLVGGFKQYMIDKIPDIKMSISTPEGLTNIEEGIQSTSEQHIPTIVLGMEHAKGLLQVGYCFDTIHPNLSKDSPLHWCFPTA